MTMNKTKTQELIIAPQEITDINGIDNPVLIYYDVKLSSTSHCDSCIICEIKNKLSNLTTPKRVEEIQDIIVNAYKHNNINVQEIVMHTNLKTISSGEDLSNYIFDGSLYEYNAKDFVLNVCKCEIIFVTNIKS